MQLSLGLREGQIFRRKNNDRPKDATLVTSPNIEDDEAVVAAGIKAAKLRRRRARSAVPFHRISGEEVHRHYGYEGRQAVNSSWWNLRAEKLLLLFTRLRVSAEGKVTYRIIGSQDDKESRASRIVSVKKQQQI